jgi:hypothetical protein
MIPASFHLRIRVHYMAKLKTLVCSLLTLAALNAYAAADFPPAWVLETSDDLADAQCVDWSGSLSIDKQQILAQGRKEIAARIRVKVTAVDEAYQSKVTQGQATALKSSFIVSSKQVVEEALQGSRLMRLEVVKHAKGQSLCGLVQIGEVAAKQLARDVVQAPGGVDQTTEEFLLAQFRVAARGVKQ